MADRAVLPQHHYRRTLNMALRATSTKIGVLEVSSIRNGKHNHSLHPALRTDWTPVDFAYPPVTPVSEALDQIVPRPYRPYKPGRYQSVFSLRVRAHQ